MKAAHTTTLATAALAAALPLATAAPQTPPRTPNTPNIIFFLADDMGYGDLAKYGAPNIDRAAREGLRFEQFYVACPICSPSRVAYTTGQYPQRWRITSFLAYTHDNANRGMANYLDPKAPTLARILKNAGYTTGHFGKWHMGGQRDFDAAPTIQAYGFDESLTNFEGLGDRILPVFSPDYNPNWKNGRNPLGLGSEKLGKGKIQWVNRWDITATYLNRAIQFIEKNKTTGKPFYVNIWPDDVHAPHEPSTPNRGDKTPRAYYAGVMREFDTQFGRLLDYIQNDPALRDNTIIIFSSDNGAPRGAKTEVGSNGNFRGGKGQIYEGGFREPLIIWAPKHLAPASIGATNTTSVLSALDLAPTLLSILGITPPAGTRFDGQDMAGILLGRSATPNRPTPLCWSRPPPTTPGAPGGNPDFAIRDGKWKLLLYPDKTTELYDLDADPGETRDLAKTNPQLVQALSAKLAAWQKDVNYEKIYKPKTYITPGKKAGKKAKTPSTDDEA